MSAPVLDEQAHFDVLAAAVEAEAGAGSVFGYGEVPGTNGNPGPIPSFFVLLSLQRTHIEPAHGGLPSRSGWRLSARYADTSTANARVTALNVTQALDGLRFTISGVTSTPLEHESASPIGPDNGRMSGMAVWTYTL